MSDGVVQTVLGDVSPSELGRTLTHEHLGLDFTHFYRKPPKHLAEYFDSGITLEHAGYLRQYPYSSRYNLEFNDQWSQNAVLSDVAKYKKYGGGTIVENTTEGLERNLDFFKQVSLSSGVHIVAGTGFYIADMQAADTQHSTTEDLYNHMVQELTVGCVDNAEIKAGFMGEIASVWPIRDFEMKAIRAAGEAQAQVGCGVSFHPHRAASAPAEIMRLYLEAGGAAGKAVMSHLDRTLVDESSLLSFAEVGCYCQLDLFGTEVSYYQLNADTDMPSDARRLQLVRALADDGRSDRVLMSHDIHTKHRLERFGGHGYSHIINNVLPRMKSKGFNQATIDQITIENPATWLTINK